MNGGTMNVRRAQSWGRLQMIALAVMFFGPALLAWLMVLNDWRPSATTNNGTLLQPPVKVNPEGWRWADGASLDTEWFLGHWTWLVPIDGACGSDCRDMLDLLRRARIALNKDADRVEIITLQAAGARPPAVRFSGLRHAFGPAADVRSLLASGAGSGAGHGLFIVDYQAFRMMDYPMPLDGSGLLDDMQRLLKLSNERVERYQQLRKQTNRDPGTAGSVH